MPSNLDPRQRRRMIKFIQADRYTSTQPSTSDSSQQSPPQNTFTNNTRKDKEERKSDLEQSIGPRPLPAQKPSSHHI